MRNRIVLFLFLALHLVTPGSAQNVNGHWYGIGMVQVTREYNNYLSEMVLQQKGSAVTGALHYYFKDSLVNVRLTGEYDEQTRELYLRPFLLMYYRSPTARNSIDCKVSGRFILTASKTGSLLTGSLESDADHKYTVPVVTYRLKRSDDTAALVRTDEPEKITGPELDAAVAPPTPENQTVAEFGKRENIVARELEVVNSTLRVELYDNGEIDYDSVSVFLNKKLILPKTKLDHRAIRLIIRLDPALEVNELSMFAENLGRIPPNTAAMIVNDGTTRYEIQLTSDLNKNATLRLRRKKE